MARAAVGPLNGAPKSQEKPRNPLILRKPGLFLVVREVRNWNQENHIDLVDWKSEQKRKWYQAKDWKMRAFIVVVIFVFDIFDLSKVFFISVESNVPAFADKTEYDGV